MISRYSAETLKRGPNEEEEAVHQVILKLINKFLRNKPVRFDRSLDFRYCTGLVVSYGHMSTIILEAFRAD